MYTLMNIWSDVRDFSFFFYCEVVALFMVYHFRDLLNWRDGCPFSRQLSERINLRRMLSKWRCEWYRSCPSVCDTRTLTLTRRWCNMILAVDYYNAYSIDTQIGWNQSWPHLSICSFKKRCWNWYKISTSITKHASCRLLPEWWDMRFCSILWRIQWREMLRQ